MRVFFFFFIIVLSVELNSSCSLSKQEIRAGQINSTNTHVVPITKEKAAIKDSLPSTASLNTTSAKIDTVTGILSVAGNEPFTSIVLTISPGIQYHIEADSSIVSGLWMQQGKYIGVVGVKKSNPVEMKIHVSSFYTVP